MYNSMLCQTGTVEDLNREGWAGEIKFDGTRAFLIKTDRFMIQNRFGIDYTRRLPEITLEAEKSDHTYILDGEICHFNSEGLSLFTPCQRRCSTQDLGKIYFLKGKYPVTYAAFDILEVDGEDFRGKPYWKRKELLKNFLQANNFKNIMCVEHSEQPKTLFEDIVERGGEGIILKRLESKYFEGVRSYDWLKIKLLQKTVCEVVGFTQGNGLRSNHFGSLVLAQNGGYVGNCGGGFSDGELEKITGILIKCPRIKPPFDIGEPYTAVKTDLKVQIRYYRKTETGVFRFPSFLSS